MSDENDSFDDDNGSVFDGSSDEENNPNTINIDPAIVTAAQRLIKSQPLKKAARKVKTKGSRTPEEITAMQTEVEEYLTNLFSLPYCFARYQGRFVSCRCICSVERCGSLSALAIRLGESSKF